MPLSLPTETASDHSDIETRIKLLNEELRRQKLEAERLKKEKKRKKKEKLREKEEALKKQVEVRTGEFHLPSVSV
jgi:centrosomal protein CEP350